MSAAPDPDSPSSEHTASESTLERRIVVLDGHTLNPGDLSWSALDGLGQLEVHPRTLAVDRNALRALVVERARNAEIVLTNKVRLDDATLAELPGLRYVGILATGTEVVDVDAARRRGIVVCNVPGYSTTSVAQLVIAYLVDAASQASAHFEAVKNGNWQTCPDFSFNLSTLHDLAGKTLGIVGLGAIGGRVANIAGALGMRVLAKNRSGAGQSRAKTSSDAAVERVTFETLLEESDFVSLHCPLTDETRRLMAEPQFQTMRASAYLINTARGPLVDEPALTRALDEGEVAGAYLDVLSQEPPRADHPLIGHPRCHITPHIGWTTREARERLLAVVADNIRAFDGDSPQNQVNSA